MNKIYFFVFSFWFFIGCAEKQSKEHGQQFIRPLIPTVQIPFKEYLLNAGKGDTLVYKSGSIILFSPNSFIDKNGNVVKGNVRVKYREFIRPIDFYLSGIPMSYDSSGKTYHLESSAMCEIVAYQDSEPVFVNPKAQPELNLANSNREIKNLYYLDTVAQKWDYMGECTVLESGKRVADAGITTVSSHKDFIEPIRPEKANNITPVVRIVVDPASFEELMAYDNLKFQIDTSDKSFNPKDAKEDWSTVELVKGKARGLYTIKFSNAMKSVSYAAKPVLEGKDYDKAIRVFEKKRKQYADRINQRLVREQKDKVQNFQDSAQLANNNKRIEKLNRLVETRNRRIEENTAMEEASSSITSFSTFSISRFGIHNCDRPMLKALSPPIAATFKNKDGNTVALHNVAVICRNFNSVFKFEDNNIRVVEEADNMIIGTVNGLFAYFTYDDFRKISTQAKSIEFTMHVVSTKENNLDYIMRTASKE